VNGVLLLGPKLRERFESELVELGYIIHAVETVASIDDIAAALLELKAMTPAGAIGAIAIGPAATLLLEAATVLPQLDGIALYDVRLPGSRPHYARMRVQVQIHRAEQGSAMTADDVQRILDESAPGFVQVFEWTYATANDRFVTEPRDEIDASHSVTAWDYTRDFLTTALPVVQGV
jgi:dienelactone hydrolase